MATVIDLGKKVKAKYPGIYDDLSDIDLGNKVKAKYPGSYDDFENIGAPVKDEKIARPRSAVSKGFHLLEKVTNVLSEPLTRKGYAPLGEKLAKTPEAKARITALMGQKEIPYPSDVLEELVPVLKGSGQFKREDITSPLGAITGPVSRIAAKTMIDAYADPLSWITLGQSTRLGKLVEAVHQAKISKQPIKLDSKVAKLIAQEMKASKPTPTVIGKFLKKYPKPGTNVTQEMLKKERSLVSIGAPFVGSNIPILTGKPAALLTAPFTELSKTKASKTIENMVRDVFSTKSGHKDFDLLMGKARDIVNYNVGVETESGLKLNKELNTLSKELGLSRDELNDKLSAVGEHVRKFTKPKYEKDIINKLENIYHDRMVTSKVKFANLKDKYKAAFAAGDDDLAVEIKDRMNKHAQDIAEYNGELNKLKGHYAPPPSMNPKETAINKELQAKYSNTLFREQVSGVPSLPLLADVGYIPHVSITEAMDAARQVMKDSGKLPPKLSSKEFDTRLVNSYHRQFNEIKPKVVRAYEKAGLLTPREAKAILNKKPLSIVTKDKFGIRHKVQLPSGMKMIRKLMRQGRISNEQYTDLVHTLTVPEVNALSHAGKLENMFGDYRGDIFHTDPVYQSTIRGVRGAVAATSSEFYNELKSRGIVVPDNKAPTNWVNVRQKELKGYSVPPEIARVMNKFDDFQTNPEEWNKFWRLYDKAHRYQKITTLAPFPPYHLMNAVGNVWQNFLGDVINPDVYRQAAFVRNGKKVTFANAYGGKWTTPKIWDEANKLGVIGQGQYSRDIQLNLGEQISRSDLKFTDFTTPSTRNRFLRAGLKVGKEIEDNARLAHFIDRLRKGDTAEQAAASVKKFLFDYGDLTDIEKKTMNRGFFFYAWLRKNLPLQLHGLVTQPGKYGVPYKLRHEIEKETERPNEKYLAEYFKENFPARIKYDKKTGKALYFFFNRWFPSSDLVKLTNIHDIALQSITPIPKEIAQQLWNQDFFTKKKIQTVPGETAKMFGKDLPIRLVHGMKVIRLLNEIDKMTKEDTDLFTKTIGILTGKTQEFDETQGMVANKSRVDKEIEVLQSAIFKEAVKPQTPLTQKRIEEIVKLIEQKVEEY